MQTIPTAEDIKARRMVRFTAGHLAKYEGWTGTLVGYNDLYDTVHVYVDAPGNPESGSKISYGRKDVEFCDERDRTSVVERREVPAPAPSEHRETRLTVAGVERVIRTEIGGKIRTVKQLEAGHTKTVKAALVEMRKVGAPTLRAKARAVGDGGTGAFSKLAARWERGVFVSHGTPGVSTAPFPKVRYTTEIPGYLFEIDPGHWVTEGAAELLTGIPWERFMQLPEGQRSADSPALVELLTRRMTTVQPVDEPLPTVLPAGGESFLDALLKNVA
ncbi:hypothetical protein [Streptomyces canus]|uniref:hypothetical protein n=1 Tax=Streptomyces canus TaxID=58343 RepID=UPI00386462AB|nr:hypothetical protein OH824_35030 [Streptomyces canus]